MGGRKAIEPNDLEIHLTVLCSTSPNADCDGDKARDDIIIPCYTFHPNFLTSSNTMRMKYHLFDLGAAGH